MPLERKGKHSHPPLLPGEVDAQRRVRALGQRRGSDPAWRPPSSGLRPPSPARGRRGALSRGSTAQTPSHLSRYHGRGRRAAAGEGPRAAAGEGRRARLRPSSGLRPPSPARGRREFVQGIDAASTKPPRPVTTGEVDMQRRVRAHAASGQRAVAWRLRPHPACGHLLPLAGEGEFVQGIDAANTKPPLPSPRERSTRSGG